VFFDGEPVGCGGFRVVSPGLAELTRIYVRPSLRGRGGAAVLLRELERAAVGFGLTTARLDTRKDLVEARRLYSRHGYVEIPAFNSSPYADHWFEKSLV
jgi:GNAT superfamily N-acetyltransferase